MSLLLASVESGDVVAFTWSVMGNVVVLLGVAALLGLICERIGLSGIVGAMLAGVLVGPGVLGFVGGDDNLAVLSTIAETGVALLLFTIGLEITRATLRSFGGGAVVAGVLQITATGGVAYLTAMWCELGVKTSVTVGAIIALSSTAAVAGMLRDRGEADSPHGRLALGMLILQDVALVPLVLVVTFMGSSGDTQQVVATLGVTAVAMLAAVVVILLVGLWVLPRLLRGSNTSGNHDLPVVLAVVVGMMAAMLCHQIGLSPAMGAFVAGLALADSPFARQIRSDVSVLKGIFLTLFFASIGTLADPSWLMEGGNLLLVIGVALAIVVGKATCAAIAGRLSGAPLAVAIGAGLCVAEIGEFSFVLGAVGMDVGVLDADTFQVLTSASLFTLLAVPLLGACARPLGEAIAPVRGAAATANGESAPVREGHVVIVGGGPAGRMALQVLLDHGLEAVVVDMNPHTADVVESLGQGAVIGDATRRELLYEVSIGTAAAVLVTLPDPISAVRVIETVRTCAPSMLVIARGRYNRHAALLTQAGADLVVNEEDQVGDQLGHEVVDRLGARPLF